MLASSPEQSKPPTPELGHLVEGLDFTGVVEWAKEQDIPAFESMKGIVGSTPVTIDGKSATVGWVRSRPATRNTASASATPGFLVDNSGGEDIVIVEGSLYASVLKPDSDNGMPQPNIFVEARGNRPGFLQFDGGDNVILRDANGPDKNTCWYVCFYPEA